MNGIKNLRTNSTGTVHAAMYGHPACPSRARTSGYTETDEAVTCGTCVKLLADVEALRANPDADCYRRSTSWILATWQESQTHPFGLSRRQLDGIACITCHRTDAAMVLVDTECGQLFQCADHLAPITETPAASVKVLAAWRKNGPVLPDVTEDLLEDDRITNLIQLAMSGGAFLAHESLDLNGYADALDITTRVARRELTEEDIDDLRFAFRSILARRSVPDTPAALIDKQPCGLANCVECELAAA